MSVALAELGYAFVRGPTGDPSDWVLRQTASGHASEGCVAATHRHNCQSAQLWQASVDRSPTALQCVWVNLLSCLVQV